MDSSPPTSASPEVKEKKRKKKEPDDGGDADSPPKEKKVKDKRDKSKANEVEGGDAASHQKEKKVKDKKEKSKGTGEGEGVDKVKKKRVANVEGEAPSHQLDDGEVGSPQLVAAKAHRKKRPVGEGADVADGEVNPGSASPSPSSPATGDTPIKRKKIIKVMRPATAEKVDDTDASTPSPAKTILKKKKKVPEVAVHGDAVEGVNDGELSSPSPKAKRSKPPRSKTRLELELEGMPLPPSSGGGGLDGLLRGGEGFKNTNGGDDDLLAILGSGGELPQGHAPPPAAVADEDQLLGMLDNLSNFERRPKPKAKRPPKATVRRSASPPTGETPEGAEDRIAVSPPTIPKPKGKKKMMVKKVPPPLHPGGGSLSGDGSPAPSPPGVRPGRTKRPPSPGKQHDLEPSPPPPQTLATSTPGPLQMEVLEGPVEGAATTATADTNHHGLQTTTDVVNVSLADFAVETLPAGTLGADIVDEADPPYPPSRGEESRDGGFRMPPSGTSHLGFPAEGPPRPPRSDEEASMSNKPAAASAAVPSTPPPILSPTSNRGLSRVSSFGSATSLRRERLVSFSETIDDKHTTTAAAALPAATASTVSAAFVPQLAATTPRSVPPTAPAAFLLLEPIESSAPPPTEVEDASNWVAPPSSSGPLSPTSSVSATIDRGLKAHSQGQMNLSEAKVVEAAFERSDVAPSIGVAPHAHHRQPFSILDDIVMSQPASEESSLDSSRELSLHYEDASIPVSMSPPRTADGYPSTTEEERCGERNVGLISERNLDINGVGDGFEQAFYDDAFNTRVSQPPAAVPPSPPAIPLLDAGGAETGFHDLRNPMIISFGGERSEPSGDPYTTIEMESEDDEEPTSSYHRAGAIHAPKALYPPQPTRPSKEAQHEGDAWPTLHRRTGSLAPPHAAGNPLVADHVVDAAANKGAEVDLNDTFREFLTSFGASSPTRPQRASSVHPMHAAHRERNRALITAPLFQPRQYPPNDADLIAALNEVLNADHAKGTIVAKSLDDAFVHEWSRLKKRQRNALTKQSQLRNTIRAWDDQSGIAVDALGAVRSDRGDGPSADETGSDDRRLLRALLEGGSPMSTESVDLLLRTKMSARRRRNASREQRRVLYDAFLLLISDLSDASNDRLPEELLATLLGLHPDI